MNAEPPSALILAAGFSSRMQELKPLLPLGGKNALDRLIGTFLSAEIADIRVVLGYRGVEIAEKLFFRDEVTFLYNPDYAKGMLSSLRCGVQNLPQEGEMFFLCPGDVPTFKADTVRGLLRAYEESGGKLFYPVYEGEKGHPILLASAIAKEILVGCWPEGLRSLLALHQGAKVPVTDRGILRDMDTPEEYAALEADFSSAPDYLGFAAAFLAKTPLPDHLLAHCDKVAEVASVLGKALNDKGMALNETLLFAAGRIHDFAKGEKGHAQIGRQRLLQAGQPELAVLVGAHMGTGIDPDASLSEKDVLFLADKMVKGDRLVGIDRRFAIAYEKFGDLPQLRQREAKAKAIAKKVETVLHASLETVLAGK